MDWNEFINPQLFFLVAFVYAVGMFLKNVPAFKAEWSIPLVLWAVSITAATLVMAIQLGYGFTAETFLSGLLQGTFIASCSVFGNELIKQVTVRRRSDKKHRNKHDQD